MLVLLLIIGGVSAACSQNADYASYKEDNKKDSQNNGETNPLPPDELDYSFVRRNEKCYILFKDISVYDNESKNELAALEFPSIKDMKSAVTSGNLNYWQKKVVDTAFTKDEIGVVSCDFDKLFVPKLPAGGSVTSVIWSGETYSFSLNFETEIFGILHCYTNEQYAEVYNSDYVNYFKKDTISVTKTETFDDGLTVTYYSTKLL